MNGNNQETSEQDYSFRKTLGVVSGILIFLTAATRFLASSDDWEPAAKNLGRMTGKVVSNIESVIKKNEEKVKTRREVETLPIFVNKGIVEDYQWWVINRTPEETSPEYPITIGYVPRNKDIHFLRVYDSEWKNMFGLENIKKGETYWFEVGKKGDYYIKEQDVNQKELEARKPQVVRYSGKIPEGKRDKK